VPGVIGYNPMTWLARTFEALLLPPTDSNLAEGRVYSIRTRP
jgi:hypothetical protein